MFREFWKHRRERRGDYSFTKHLARLKREGRLPQIGLGTVAVVLLAAMSFGRCDSNITGPASGPSYTTSSGSLTPLTGEDGGVAPSPGTGGTSGSETFKDRTVDRDFVFTGTNPCNGDAVRAEGHRHEYIRITTGTNSSGPYFSSTHHMRDHFKGFALNDPEQKYRGEDEHREDRRFSATKFDEHIHTEEYLKAYGPEPDFSLYLHYRLKFQPTTLNIEPEFTAKARCHGQCSKSAGCPDQDFVLVSVKETEVPVPIQP